MCEQPIEKLIMDRIDMEIAEMLTHLENLKYLRVRNASLSEVITIMRKAKRLIELNIYYYNLSELTFDLRLFELIVALATGRIRVKFCYRIWEVGTLSQVPKEKNEWVHFIQHRTLPDTYF